MNLAIAFAKQHHDSNVSSVMEAARELRANPDSPVRQALHASWVRAADASYDALDALYSEQAAA